MADSKRGRPRKEGATRIPIGTLVFYVGFDDDLIEYFASIPVGKRRNAVRFAMRGGIKKVVVDDIPDDTELESAAKGFIA